MGKVLALVGVVLASFALVGTALANHSWGGYHWSRSANPLVLSVGDNVDSRWDAYLDGAIADWSASTVLDLNKVVGRNESRELWSDRRPDRSLQWLVWFHGLARHRADLAHVGQPHHPGDDQAQRHVLRHVGVQHAPLATPRRVPGDRARLRARSPGRELQQSEPGHVHGLHERPDVGPQARVTRATSTRISTTSTSSSRSTPTSTGQEEAAASRATARSARTVSTAPHRSRRPARRTATCTSTTCRTGAAASRTCSGRSARPHPNG